MKSISYNNRLVRRAYWLVKVRWIAIAGTCFVIFIAGNVLCVSVQSTKLYCATAMLILENVISLLLLKRLGYQAGLFRRQTCGHYAQDLGAIPLVVDLLRKF